MKNVLIFLMVSIGIIGVIYLAPDVIEFGNSLLVHENSKDNSNETKVKIKDPTTESANDVEINDDTLKELLKRPHKIVSKKIKISKKNNFVSRYILVPSADIKSMLNEDRAILPNILTQAQKVVKILKKCLFESDLCGQRDQYSKEEYFDAELTPFHHDLNRAISIIAAISEQNSNFNKEIDRQALIDAIKIQNPNIPLSALEALLKIPLNTQEFEQIVINSRNILPHSRPIFFSMMSEQEILNQGNNRNLFLNEIYRALKNDDLSTAYEVQKNLSTFHLNENEFAKALEASCRMKTAGINGDMWPVVKGQLEKQLEFAGFNLKVDEFCHI